MRYIIFTLLLPIISSAQTVPFVMHLLNEPQDARSMALGKCGVSTGSDGNTFYLNPAKIRDTLSSTTNWAVNYHPFLSLYPFYIISTSISNRINSKLDAGVSYRRFSFSSRPYDSFEDVFSGHFSWLIKERMAIGATFSYGRLTLYPIGPTSIASGDLGWRYRSNEYQFKASRINMQTGIAFRNIGPKVSIGTSTEKLFLPATLQLGSTMNIKVFQNHMFSFSAELAKLLIPSLPEYGTSPSNFILSPGKPIITKGRDPNRSSLNALFTSFFDAPGGLKQELTEIQGSVGVEYGYKRFLFFRGGMYYTDPTGGDTRFISFGTAWRVKNIELASGLILPFVFSSSTTIMNNHVFSVIAHF